MIIGSPGYHPASLTGIPSFKDGRTAAENHDQAIDWEQLQNLDPSEVEVVLRRDARELDAALCPHGPRQYRIGAPANHLVPGEA